MDKEKLKHALETGECHKSLVTYVYQSDGTTKEIRESNYIAESMKLNQKLISGNSFELGGCIASQFSLKVFNIDFELKDKEIQVDLLVTVGVETEIIHLFRGKITESEKDNKNDAISTIKAYDALGISGDEAVQINPILLPNAFISVINMLRHKSGMTIDLDKETTKFMWGTAYNHNISLGEGKSIPIRQALHEFCELYGAFGFIDGGGAFKLVDIIGQCGRFLRIDQGDRQNLVFNSITGSGLPLTPGNEYVISTTAAGTPVVLNVMLSDGAQQTIALDVTPVPFVAPDNAVELIAFTNKDDDSDWWWREIANPEGAISVIPMPDTKYKDYALDPITGVQYFLEKENTENTDEKYETVLVGTNENPYTISGNTVYAQYEYKDEIAEVLYFKFQNAIFGVFPVESMSSVGYPGIVNVGDLVSDGKVPTHVFERTLTGIQGLKDIYAAQVEQNLPIISPSSSTVSGTTSEATEDVVDESWHSLELNDGITAVSEICSAPRYRKVGNRVYIEGGVSIALPATTPIVMATLPEGFRPNATGHFITTTAGFRVARFWVNKDGRIALEWAYHIVDGVDLTSSTSGSISWLSIKCDFFVD